MRITRTRPKTITASRHQTKGNALWLISILCVTETVFTIQMGGLQLSDFHCIASAQMAFNTVTVRKLFELVASQRSRACAFGLLLAALTIFVYRPSWNGGFLWDDDDYITHNELLTAPDGLRRIWFSLDSPSQYFPLVYTTFRIEHALWGMNPTGYHWINLILHVANALLVWRALVRLKVPGAWLAGAIFALHRHGLTGSLVGTLPSGYARGAFCSGSD